MLLRNGAVLLLGHHSLDFRIRIGRWGRSWSWRRRSRCGGLVVAEETDDLLEHRGSQELLRPMTVDDAIVQAA